VPNPSGNTDGCILDENGNQDCHVQSEPAGDTILDFSSAEVGKISNDISLRPYQELPTLSRGATQICSVTVYASPAGSFGSLSSSSSSSGHSGSTSITDHLYIVTNFTDDNEGISIAKGYRAGPAAQTPGNFGSLEAIDGYYNKDFPDYELSPRAIYSHVTPGTCGAFDASFQRTTDWTNKAQIGYELTRQNSNAFTYTALKLAGLNPDAIKNVNAIGWGVQLSLPDDKKPKLNYPRF
jgi:hypothetical protein